MTFSSMVKNEIVQNQKLKARYDNQQTYGLLLCAKSFSVQNIEIHTAERAVARRYTDAIADWIRLTGTLTTREEPQRGGRTLYVVRVDSVADRAELLNRFAMLYPEGVSYDRLGGDEETAAFLGGVFLACGAITDPEKDYHLEFAPPRAELSKIIKLILEEVGFTPKTVLRRSVPVVYFGDSEQIEDLLTFMNCPRYSLELMSIKITKERRNAANRAANCDTANIDKTVSAAAAQIEAIEALGADNLPDDLRQLARLRLENPGDSLRDLGARLEPPLTRSGVNHRMARILALAEKAGATQKQTEEPQ